MTDNKILHMKLKNAVAATALLAFLPVSLVLVSPALAGICFLPDCADKDLAGGSSGLNINEDTKWCKENGYKITSCSITQYLSDQCPNGEPLYKSCKTDNDRACQELKYTKACPSGEKLKKDSGRCSYDSSYGTCCKPTGCPDYTSLISSSYGTNGTDGCEYTCYYPYQSCCTYITTEAYCSSKCKKTSGSSCVKNGTTYYSGCGASKCSSGQTCKNGTCRTNMSGKRFSCCDDVGYGCSSYYGDCKRYTYLGDCSDVVASYKSQGCSPIFQYCAYTSNAGFYIGYIANFRCQ